MATTEQRMLREDIIQALKERRYGGTKVVTCESLSSLCDELGLLPATKTQVRKAIAALHYAQERIRWVRVFDGSSCGPVRHHISLRD